MMRSLTKMLLVVACLSSSLTHAMTVKDGVLILDPEEIELLEAEGMLTLQIEEDDEASQEQDKDSVGIISNPESTTADGTSSVNASQGNSGNGGSSCPHGSGPSSGSSSLLASMQSALLVAAPVAVVAAKVVVAGAAIALGMQMAQKYGSFALTGAGTLALTVMGMDPVTAFRTSAMVTGMLTLKIGSEASLLEKAASAVLGRIPWVGGWLSSKLAPSLDVDGLPSVPSYPPVDNPPVRVPVPAY